MSEIAIQIFKVYGGVAIIIAVLAAFLIWLLAHWAASPGTEVSVLWGLVKYTKPQTAHISPSQDAGYISNAKEEVLSFKKGLKFTPIALNITNSLTKKNLESTLTSLRARRTLRELNAFESGKQISQLPFGTYYFIYISRFAYLSGDEIPKSILASTTERFRASRHYFEMHSLTDHAWHVLAYLSESDAAQISKLSGETIHSIVLSPTLVPPMTSLVSIPIDRIISSYQRTIQFSKNEESNVVDLKLK